jgi:hypothetical protein
MVDTEYGNYHCIHRRKIVEDLPCQASCSPIREIRILLTFVDTHSGVIVLFVILGTFILLWFR